MPPIIFIHIPKTAGTSLRIALHKAFNDCAFIQGFDHLLFGDFKDFGSIRSDLRLSIYADPTDLLPGASLIAGHFSHSTVRAAYPTGRFMTVLREPTTRLLSHWLYWRQQSDADLDGWGAWIGRVRRARLPLIDFLEDPELACQTDNLVVRMLLWPHRLIPNNGFIDPAHDRRLLREARAKLRRLDFVDIVENVGFKLRLEHWLGRAVILPRENETARMPTELRSPLGAELRPAAHRVLEDRCRLDIHLWSDLAGRLTVTRPMILRNRIVMDGCCRYGALMGADS